ncbi:MAG: cytochrome c oxidase subunit II [Candidatus Latescibacteria bacterium]|nr:cytochrome c oxidase subunit II [Candidatus Latescibacterota bacterium]
MLNFPLWPKQASTVAPWVDLFYIVLVLLSILFCVLVFGMITFFIIKYRRRSDAEQPVQIHGNLPLELLWTVIPLFLAIGVFAGGADLFFRLARVPNDPMDVYIVGKQWMWKVQHAQGKREINELHVPLGQTVRLTLASEDVLHDFFIPAFRVKMDAVPGRYTTMWFEATELGEFHIFCAEFCGTQHSGMIGKVTVMEPEDFQSWMDGGAQGETIVEAGERKFSELACDTCHKNVGSGRGPSLVNLYGHNVELEGGREVLVDDEYLRQSILNSQASIVAGYQPIMPLFQGQISEETLLQLIAYIKSLSETAE